MQSPCRRILLVLVVLSCICGRRAGADSSGSAVFLNTLSTRVLSSSPLASAASNTCRSGIDGVLLGSPLVLRGGGAEEDDCADAMADNMADEMVDEMQEEQDEEREESDQSANPVRVLIEEGCAAWDDDNNADEAERAFRQALSLDPTNPDALCSMGVLLHESGRDLKAAEEYFSKSLEHSPEHVDTLHFYGNLLYAHHNDDAAELLYKRAVQVIEAQGVDDPDDVHPLYVDTLCNHGALMDRVRQDIDGAQALYEKALAFNPEHRSVLFNYGILLEDGRKDVAGAEAMYRKALLQDGEDVEVLINLGLLLQQHSKDFNAAEDCFQRAVAAAPSHGDALTNYGALLEEVRLDLDGARSCYERAVVSNGHDVVALCHLSGLLSRQGKGDEAERHLEAARQVDPTAADAVMALRRKAHLVP